MFLKCSFLVAVLIFVLPAVAENSSPEEIFKQDGVLNWNCRYLESHPNIIHIRDKSGTIHPVCVGVIVCDAKLLETGQLGKNEWLVASDANPNGTCPTAYEAVTKASDMTVKREGTTYKFLKIQSRAEAIAEYERSLPPTFLGVELGDQSNNVVTKVHDDSTASLLGIKVKDRILAIGKTPISDFPSLRQAVKEYRGGDAITISIERDEKKLELGPVPLGTRLK